MDNNNCKFIEIWYSYSCLSSYLDQIDRIKLSSVNSVVRKLTQNQSFWPNIELNNNMPKLSFMAKMKWFSKCLRKCHPKNLTISLFDLNQQQINAVVNMLMQGTVESVQKLDIYCESQDIHLASSLCFANIHQLTIRSKCATNQLLKFMTQNIKKLYSLVVIKNDLQFTCSNLSKYMPNPMRKLVMKPYVLQFDQLAKVSQISAQTLTELQIDVEQCNQTAMTQIIKPLRHLQRLRLYHLQNLQDDTVLYQLMQKQQKIRQLALTKTYNMPLTRILQAVTSSYLQIVDLTDSKFLKDSDVCLLSKGCPKLKQVNLSWCNGVTSVGLKNLISDCLLIEILNITGVKQSKDIIFGNQYNSLLSCFDQDKFNKARAVIVNSDSLQNKDELYELTNYFSTPIELQKIKVFKRLRVLDCQSCNGISDNILKIIYLLNPRIRAFNYYGNYMGLFPTDNQTTFC